MSKKNEDYIILFKDYMNDSTTNLYNFIKNNNLDLSQVTICYNWDRLNLNYKLKNTKSLYKFGGKSKWY